MRMPYDENLEVRGVLKDYLDSESLLPRTGNHIGDTWIVGNVPWVWITAPGTTAPAWIDPYRIFDLNIIEIWSIKNSHPLDI